MAITVEVTMRSGRKYSGQVGGVSVKNIGELMPKVRDSKYALVGDIVISLNEVESIREIKES